MPNEQQSSIPAQVPDYSSADSIRQHTNPNGENNAAADLGRALRPLAEAALVAGLALLARRFGSRHQEAPQEPANNVFGGKVTDIREEK